MKRLSLLILVALLSLGVWGVGPARADAGHDDRQRTYTTPAATTAPAAVTPTDATQAKLAAHIEFGDHRHGDEDGCDGTCASCCATACSATALTATPETSIRFLSGLPIQFAMASTGYGRKFSPPSPPPRS